MDTDGRTVIVSISTKAVQNENTRQRDTRRRQLLQTQWEVRKKKDWVKGIWRFGPGEKKSKEINIVINLNQIPKKSAWDNSTVDNTAFLDTSASLHLVHEWAPTEKNIPQQQQKTVTIPNGQSMKT